VLDKIRRKIRRYRWRIRGPEDQKRFWKILKANIVQSKHHGYIYPIVFISSIFLRKHTNFLASKDTSS
jgi:1-acyl-sn-glycerol-3-phosphate acyltransferase